MTNDFFFIIGSPRSGTTLLERLMNKHSQLFIPPETAYFHLLKKKGLLYQKFDANSMRLFLRYYLPKRSFFNFSKMEVVEQRLLQGANSYADTFLNLIGLLKENSGNPDRKPRAGEKTPHHLRCATYLLETFPKALFLGMVRDGRAVVRSRLTHPNWEHNLIAAANIWRSDAELLRNLKSGIHGERVHIIRYEQLVSEPEKVLKEVCTFLGEEFEPAMLEEKSNISASYTDFYQRHWMAKSMSKIDSKRATAWIHEYKPSELALVEKIIKGELQNFGYEPKASKNARWRMLLIKEWLRHLAYRIYRWIYNFGNK